MTDAKDQRMDNTYPDAQEIDDAIELFELFKDPLSMWGEPDKRAFELGITALRYMKGSLNGESDRKKARQTGPAKGQTYWFAHIDYADSYTYTAGYFDLDICKNISIYPEKRFAQAELRAKRLIQAVNKRRRELNEGKQFVNHQCYIVFWNVSGLDFCEGSNQASAPGFAYPFGVFKSSVDCEMCVREFKNELEWFYKEYSTLMAELDDYDWADAPGWGE